MVNDLRRDIVFFVFGIATGFALSLIAASPY